MQTQQQEERPFGAVLVIGGGIGGIQAALDLADSGYFVHLVEKAPGIGGVMSQLDKTFPTNDCSMCILSPKLVEVGRHANIALHTLSTVEGIAGKEGDFTVTVRRQPIFVDPDKCIACGRCAEKCPVKIPDEFEQGLGQRKAIYLYYPQAVPLKYTIDPEHCLYLQKDRCGACEKLCPAGAINFADQEEVRDLHVGAVIVTAGVQTFDPAGLDTYHYAGFQNVLTSIEFERMLAAGGPTSGEIIRPSDQRPAKRIAWLQCVGSRDINRCDNDYCSGVCCMYAIKEAIIAADHVGDDCEASIFYIDLRTSGKDFEKAYYRAKQEGIRFVRSRVHTIEPADDNGSLSLTYTTDAGRNVSETFDLVVLSVGLEPAAGAVSTAEKLGILLDQYQFVKTEDLAPVATSIPGIFAAGGISGCKDIPQTVVEAGAAAGAAGELLNPARGTQIKATAYPPELPVEASARIGVFVCNCGANIGAYADVPEIVAYAKTLPQVTYAEENQFTCSQDTQENMVQRIKEHNLNRVVVAACTPRTHETLFQDTIKAAGLNPYLFEMANIRNQCTWCHSTDKEKATEKARDMVRMSVAKAALLAPIDEISVPIDKSALVVGAGVAGMNAALSLANQGAVVYLVEKKEDLGGAAKEISRTWSGADVQAYLTELKQAVTTHDNIHVFLNATVEESAGFIGNYETTVVADGDRRTFRHGVAIFATGAVAADTDEYLYHQSSRVTRWHELEADPAALEQADAIGFIQCVGSRNADRPYCSRVCCTTSISQAIHIKETWPEKAVYIFYRDIRTPGHKETLYAKARALGVTFIRYDQDQAPRVTETGDGLAITVFEPILQTEIEVRLDLLNLATALVPNDTRDLVNIFKLPRNDEKFFMEAHVKLRPVEFASDGLYLCGLAHYPKPIEESIAQAQAAASRAATVLSKDQAQISPTVSQIDTALCIGCGLCASVCPFGAIEMDADPDKGQRPRAISASCKGCGVCAASCPRKAIDMLHFTDEQIEAAIAAAF